MVSRRAHLLFLVALVIALLSAACGGDDGNDTVPGGGGGQPADTTPGGGEPENGPVVAVKGLTYQPAKIEVAVGETVTWRFDDRAVAHNVVGDGLKSPLKRSGTYTYTFDEAGTYQYRCTVHPGMKGSVVVS